MLAERTSTLGSEFLTPGLLLGRAAVGAVVVRAVRGCCLLWARRVLLVPLAVARCCPFRVLFRGNVARLGPGLVIGGDGNARRRGAFRSDVA